MKVFYNLKVLFILSISFFVLCSCSIVNKRSEMVPVAGNGWDVKTTEATLSGWRNFDYSSSNNDYSQASYRCDNHRLFLNSIPDLSYSFYGYILPFFPIYYKRNELMSVFMLPDDQETLMVKSVTDCPELFSSSSPKIKLKKISGEDNLCKYQFKNNQLDQNELKLSLLDDANNCKIKDINLVRKSNWNYCLICYLNVATQPVGNYRSQESVAYSSNNNRTPTVTINSHKTTGKKIGATIIGVLFGGYVASELSNCRRKYGECGFHDETYTLLGMFVGGYIGASQVDNTGAKVNFIYPF